MYRCKIRFYINVLLKHYSVIRFLLPVKRITPHHTLSVSSVEMFLLVLTPDYLVKGPFGQEARLVIVEAGGTHSYHYPAKNV
jgi:hypothetical protein